MPLFLYLSVKIANIKYREKLSRQNREINKVAFGKADSLHSRVDTKYLLANSICLRERVPD